MKHERWLAAGALCLVVGCKDEAHPTRAVPEIARPPGSSMSAPALPGATSSASVGAAADVAPFAAPPSGADGPPASFAGTKKETIENAVGLGCEAHSSNGFLELLCRKKNGTGGRPVQAAANANAVGEGAAADPSDTVAVDEHGELRLVLPFHEGASKDVTLEFSDTRYVLRVSGASAKLEWAAGGLPLRRACAKVAADSKSILKAAQQAPVPERVLASELVKFPRLGVCYPAGLGSWALALKALGASGEGAERRLHADIDVVRVSEQGETLTAPFASFEVSPGGLELSPLQTYDYDDDGNDELIVPYEVTAVPPGTTPAHPPSIWSFSAGGITSYAKGPELAPGGAAVEQLEFDMRPDLGSYGAYAAWFGADCGLKQCPTRLTGPRFYYRALPSGEFSQDDSAARAALKRACPKKPEVIVVPANVAQTAKNLVCARVWGISAQGITAELTEKHEALCGEAASCPLGSTLEAWANATPPITLQSDESGAAK